MPARRYGLYTASEPVIIKDYAWPPCPHAAAWTGLSAAPAVREAKIGRNAPNGGGLRIFSPADSVSRPVSGLIYIKMQDRHLRDHGGQLVFGCLGLIGPAKAAILAGVVIQLPIVSRKYDEFVDA